MLVPVLLVTLGWALTTDPAARALARASAVAIEGATGESASVGAVRVSWWPPGAVVEGLVLTHPADGEVIVTAARVEAWVGRQGWTPVFQRLELVGPQLRLHIDEEGLREFRALIDDGAPIERSSRFPWRELVIRDGGVTLHTADLDLVLADLDLAPEPAGDTLGVDLASVTVTAGSLVQTFEPIHLEKVRIAPDRVEIPAFSLKSGALTLDGRLAAVSSGPIAGDLSLGVDLDALTRAAGEEGAALGQVNVDASLTGTLPAPWISGAFSTGSVAVRSGNGMIPIGALRAPWSVDVAQNNRLRAGPILGDWGGGKVHIDLGYSPDLGVVDAALSAENLSLATVLRDVGALDEPWVDFRADVDTSLKISFEPFRLEGPFKLGLVDMVVDAGPVRHGHDRMLNVSRAVLEGQVRADAAWLVFDIEDAVAGPSRATALARIPLEQDGELSIDVGFSSLDLGALAPLGDAGLAGRAEVKGWLGGPYNSLSAWADMQGVALQVIDLPFADAFSAHLESPSLTSLEFSRIEAVRGQTGYSGEFRLGFPEEGMRIDTEIAVPEGRVEDLVTMFLDYDGVKGKVSGTLSLHGGLYELDGRSDLWLAGVNIEGEEFGSGQAMAWMDAGRFTLERMLLNRRAETLMVRGSVGAGWATNLEVLWDGARLETLDHLSLVNLPLTGDMALDARVGGTLFDPAPEGNIRLYHMRYAGRPVDDSVVVFTSADGVIAWKAELIGEAARMQGTVGMWGEQPYELDAVLTDFPLHTFYPVAADGQPVTATTSGVAHLEGRFGEQTEPVVIDLTLNEVEARWRSHTLRAPSPWVICMHGLRTDLAGACATEGDSTPATLSLVGNDGSDLSLTGAASGKGDARFEVSGTLAIDLLPAVVPELLDASGMAEVKFVASRRGGGAVQTEGEVKVRDAEILSAYFPSAFQELRFDLKGSAEGYVISDLSARVGGGLMTITESRIDANGWIPERYAIRTNVTGARVQYLEYLPPMVADGELNFDGPADDLLLSGNIDIQTIDFRDRIDWESAVLSLQQEYLTGSAPEDEASYFRMDLHVTADNTAHFRNNIADADASVDLRIIGDTARPGMLGSVVMAPGGSVYLQEREFELLRGEAHWRDPYSFDPELDVLLSTELESQEQDYDVSYQVTGPLSDWTTTTAATPYLAQADINALLLFGMTREEMERSGYGGLGTALVVETGDLLSAQLTRPLTNTVIDRWSLVNGATARGSAVVSDEPRLVAEIDDIAGFDVTVEGALSGDWYVGVERRVARRLYATAYATSDAIGRSVAVAAVGSEFKLRWEAD